VRLSQPISTARRAAAHEQDVYEGEEERPPTALIAAHVFAPVTAHLTTAGLSALAGADLLQLCRGRLQEDS
jgi:hypothetical protein